MKKTNVVWIIAVVLVATVVIASLAVAIGAGVAVIFADGGEDTTSAQSSEQVSGSIESTASESESQSGSTDSNPYGTTEIVDEFTNTEAIIGEEITEIDD